MTSCRVEAICAGAAAALPSGKISGIAKHPLDGRVAIGVRGIESDTQVDRRHHGYPAMALHLFPHHHYDWLRMHFATPEALRGRGSMGENLSIDGLTEHAVLIGDRFRFGSAIIEVSQPRQPCATIEQHLQRKGVVAAMVASARSGWFFRVLEPGSAEAGDALVRIERGHEGWTVARAFLVVYGKHRASDAELGELASLDRVSDRLIRDIARKHHV